MSGRISCGVTAKEHDIEIPMTLSLGTPCFSQRVTACGVTPQARANAACPPSLSIAVRRPEELGKVSVVSMPPYAKAFLYFLSRNAALAPIPGGRKINKHFMATIGQRIRQAIDFSGITQAEIARRMGVTPQAVNGWITTSTISKSNLSALAFHTKADLGWMMTGEGAPPSNSYDDTVTRDESEARGWMKARDHAATPGAARAPMMSRPSAPGVPIIGFAIATPDQDGYFTDGDHPVGHGEGRLAWGSMDPNAFALRVRGDSMQPYIRPGQIIVVEPGREVQPDNDVLVKLTNGRRMVKHLLIKRPGEYVLGSINQNHPQATVSANEVEAIYYIAAIVPRDATLIEPIDPTEGSW